MNRFSIVPTTADLAIEAFGGTLKELFAQLGLGLFSIMCDLETVRPRETLEAAVEAPSREALLVNWVNELIYLHEANQFFACKVRISQMTDTEIKAELLGEKVNPERHALLTEVKAATYHDLALEQVCIARLAGLRPGGRLGERKKWKSPSSSWTIIATRSPRVISRG